MTTTDILRASARPIRPTDATHRFAIGQTVRLQGGFGRPASPSDIYHVTGTLPLRGGSLQYRIRNDEERHERVATEDNLEPVGAPQSGIGTTLVERTFGHGQGTKTQ